MYKIIYSWIRNCHFNDSLSSKLREEKIIVRKTLIWMNHHLILILI